MIVVAGADDRRQRGLLWCEAAGADGDFSLQGSGSFHTEASTGYEY